MKNFYKEEQISYKITSGVTLLVATNSPLVPLPAIRIYVRKINEIILSLASQECPLLISLH